MPRPRRSDSSPLTVSVVEFGDRRHYQMQWVDPATNRKKTRSTGVERTPRKASRTEAERVAAKFEAELREGRYHEPTKVTWADFRERYENEVVTSLADATGDKIFGVLNAFEEIARPRMLYDVTASAVSRYQSQLRSKGLAETTIAGHLAHLRAALQWAVNQGMIPAVPKIEKPKRARTSKVMKGRPITLEEFERMLDRVPDVVGQEAAPSWRYYLRGLWLSGLRLAESLELYWDRDDKLCVDLDGKRPMLRIPAALEKGNRDRLLPMAPEFAEFLAETAREERTGPVFNPKAQRRRGERLNFYRVSRVISDIGEATGIKVSTDAKTGEVKFASAHDLRRSFGERWAARVMPQVLMELMRHESIETTMRYYVGRNAERTADALWAAHEGNRVSSNIPGNSEPEMARNRLPR